MNTPEVPVIVRGEGCYVYDEHGKRYLDGLSALYCVNIGHGRTELGAGRGASGQRSSASTRTGAMPIRASIELAARIAGLAPGDLNRVFFTSGGVRGRRVRVEAREGVARESGASARATS